MKVREAMATAIGTVSPDDPVHRAELVMREGDCSLVPVVVGRRLIGVVTEGDLRLRGGAATDLEERTVAGVMSAALVTVQPDDDLETATRRMAETGLRRLPVVDEGRLVGLLSLDGVASATGGGGPAGEAGRGAAPAA